MKNSVVAALILIITASFPASARTICTVIGDAGNHKILVQKGDCVTRVTPASTAKIALALMGFDSRYLEDPFSPLIPYEKGYADWGGVPWKQPTNPRRWLKYSVVWYSQLLAHALGETRLENYASSFGYGNADFSGDPGKNNGLDRAWIASSLKISPLEQVWFLDRFVNRELPVSDAAFSKVQQSLAKIRIDDDWEIYGKTGMAYPRKSNGRFDRDRAYGWFVGWGTKEDRTLVFARLIQEEKREASSAGVRARDAFLGEWISLTDYRTP